MSGSDVKHAIDAVRRIESPKIVSALTRIVSDVALAEELAQDALDIVDALLAEPAMRAYHPLPSVRGDLLANLDRADEARAECERAAELSANSRERELPLARADAC